MATCRMGIHVNEFLRCLFFIYPDDGGRKFLRNVYIYTRPHGVTYPKTSSNCLLEQANYEEFLKFAVEIQPLICINPE